MKFNVLRIISYSFADNACQNFKIMPLDIDLR